MDLKEKINKLIAERDAILYEINEIQKAYDNRQRRLIEIDGSIKTLDELLKEDLQENDSPIEEQEDIND